MRKLLKKRNNKKLQRLYRIAKINDMGMIDVARVFKSLTETVLLRRSHQKAHAHKFAMVPCTDEDGFMSYFENMHKIIHKRTGRTLGYVSK